MTSVADAVGPAPGGPELVDLLAALRGAADPARAADMTRYMRGQFAFLGIPTPRRRELARPLRAASRRWDATDLLAVVDRLWDEPEREHAYVACDLLRARARVLAPRHLPHLRRLVQLRSWWDTVDSLVPVVGDLVARNAELVPTMSAWVDDDDHWVVRVALLHQLGRKGAADTDRLFDACARRATDREFFVRKAIGWALRDAARSFPAEVLAFVDAHPELSGLSRREATRHLR